MNSLTLLLALALSATEAPPPAAPAPAKIEAPRDAAILTLDQAIKDTQEKNLDLKQAREKIKEVQQGWYKVLAQYLPQVSAGGAYTFQPEVKFTLPTQYWIRELPPGYAQNGPSFQGGTPTFFPDNSNPPGTPSATLLAYPAGGESLTIQKEHQFAGQVALQQAIIVPALWPAFDLADLGEKLAKESVEVARREILFAVAQLYYGAVSMKQLIAIQERLLQSNVDHVKDAQVRTDAGALPRIALIRAQIDLARAEQDVVRARQSYSSIKVSLGTLMGRETDFEVVTPDEPRLPPDVSSLEDSALRDRPDLVVARTGRDLAEKGRKSVYFQYLPNFLGKAMYQGANIKGFSNSYGSYALSVLVSWTLWDGGLREASLRENESKVLQADAALKSAELKAKDEIKRALLDLSSARANVVKAEEQRKLARENERLVTVNYQAGAATQIEVSDANTALASAELGYIAESLNSQLSALKVVKAAGAFNPQP